MSIGALLGPPAIAFLTLRYGWRVMFLITGALGFFLLLPWTILYRHPSRHSWLTESERQYLLGITEATEEGFTARIGVRDFLRYRAVWTILAARLLLDSTNYFFLFWIPDYLLRRRGFSMAMIGGLLWIPYLFSDIGLLAGGWISSAIIRSGHSVGFARKSCMLGSSALLPFGILIDAVIAPGWVVALMSIALFGFAILAVNIQTVATDLAPIHSVGTLYGMAGFAGSLGAVFWQTIIGKLADGQRYPTILMLVSLLPVATALIMLTARIEPLAQTGTTQAG